MTREVEHLRTLLERQPSCLMRIGRDGTLLAVNAAGLGLLAAPDLASVLGTSFLARIPGDAAMLWQDFLDRLAAGSGSFECELTDLSGATREVVIQAILLDAHPDGVESMLATVRDISSFRRLEASLREVQGALKAAQDA